ncbi:Uncharacterised protein [Vibrio cholerae]|nr:Uncharacterised protein [Vibrio cholerae]
MLLAKSTRENHLLSAFFSTSCIPTSSSTSKTEKA